jgi:signal transduction histidine kinase
MLNSWFKPRTLDTDRAFAETTIRVTVLIVGVAVLLSFLSSVVVFRDAWDLISFPTLDVIIFVLCLVTARVISTGQLVTSSFLLVVISLAAAVGSALVAGAAKQAGLADVLSFVLFMLSVLISALVLARKYIFPTIIVCAIMAAFLVYAVPSIPIQGVNIQTTALDPGQYMLALITILIVEGLYLRQLRVEFDRRLASLQTAILTANDAQKEAERANKAKTQFLSNMSHELRTPLNAIIGYTEIMLGGMAGTFTEKQTQLQQHVMNNGYRLRDLINDILDLSRIEAGGITISFTPLSPRTMLTELTDNLRSLTDKKQIGFELSLADNVPEAVMGDKLKIEQVITNLLSNAIKFTTKGAVTVTVTAPDKDHWRVAVKDTGIGIPQDAINYIFEEFRQVDNSDTRQFQGTGLGLAITKRLVEKMGGTIEVTSEQKVGSTFTITLPDGVVEGNSTAVKEPAKEPEKA